MPNNIQIQTPYSDKQKIAAFFDEVEREFERRDTELTRSLEAERKNAIEKAKAKTAAEVLSYKNRKIAEFTAELSGKASREILDAKHESLAATEEFLSEIKTAVREKLCEFVKDDEKYFAYICNCCRKAYEYVGEGFDLFLSPRDCEKYGERLAGELKMTFTVRPDESIKIGGVRLCQNDRGISVDETLDEKLEAKIDELAAAGV